MRRFAALALGAALALAPAVAHAGRDVSPCEAATGRADVCASVQILGHRGVQNANEDTLAALRRDAASGVGFEADTWRLASADGTPNAGPSVIIHDQTLARTVNPFCLSKLSPDTKVGNVTPLEWHHLCSQGGQPLPTLKQWIRTAGELGVSGIMEIKYHPAHMDVVARWMAESRAHISFYAAPHLYHGTCQQTAAAAARAAGLVVGLKVNSVCPVSLQQAADLGYSYVIGRDAVDPEYVERAHELGLRVGNYSSGSVATWTRLVQAGVDIIIAPHPKVLKQWLR